LVKYRPEIDGLRALAVAPVILFHAGFPMFQGGYVGVDVFFVISGYLITTIISYEIERNDFSIIRFYERRARRILPALFLVVLATIPFAWSWMVAADLKDFAKSVAAVVLFSSNFLFWKDTGYFAGVHLMPLLHTWSLAVEEQFYLLFPLFLLLLHWLWPRMVLSALAAVVVISLGLAQWGVHAAPETAFFLLPTRAWELGVGALVARTSSYWGKVEGASAEAGSLLGLGLVVFAVLVFTKATPVPGVAGLVPVLGAAGIIAFTRPSTLVGRLLTLPPVVQLGLISYSAYLWHQPLFVFARLRHFSGALSPLDFAGLIALTLLLAYASWHLVEQPFRKGARFTRAHVFLGGAGVGIVLGIFGTIVWLAKGVPARFPPEVAAFERWLGDMSPYRYTCVAYEGPDKLDSPNCLHGPSQGEPLELWGDSHGPEIAWQLSEKLAPLGVGVREMTHHACTPIKDYSRGSPHCIVFRNQAFQRLTSGESNAPVVLVGRWSPVFDPTPFDNREGGVEPGFQTDHPTPEELERRGELLRSTISTLLERGRRVVVVYPIPVVGWDVPRFLIGELIFGKARSHPLATSHKVYVDRAGPAVSHLDRVPDHPNLIRIRPSDLFCNTVLSGRCVAEIDGRPLYLDDDHPNSVGAGMISDAIIAAMGRKGWLPASRPSQ